MLTLVAHSQLLVLTDTARPAAEAVGSGSCWLLRSWDTGLQLLFRARPAAEAVGPGSCWLLHSWDTGLQGYCPASGP